MPDKWTCNDIKTALNIIAKENIPLKERNETFFELSNQSDILIQERQESIIQGQTTTKSKEILKQRKSNKQELFLGKTAGDIETTDLWQGINQVERGCTPKACTRKAKTR